MKNPFEEILMQVKGSDVIIEKYMQRDFDSERLQKEFQQTVNSMKLQVMLYGAPSSASVFVNPTMPCLLAT